MSIYKEMQLVQFENEELRIRLTDLKAQVAELEKKLGIPKYPSIVYSLQKLPVEQNKPQKYQVIDEQGYIQDLFTCESDEAAKSFFAEYKEKKRPSKKFVLASEIIEGNSACVIQMNIQYVSTVESEGLKLIEMVRHFVYLGKECIHFYKESVTEQEAIDTYLNHVQARIRLSGDAKEITTLM